MGSRLEIINNSVDMGRNKPRMFFSNTSFPRPEVVSAICRDISIFRNVEFTFEVDDTLIKISSNVDWMDGGAENLDLLFSQFIPKGKDYPNDHRSEVLVSAISDWVYTDGLSGEYSSGLNADQVAQFREKNKNPVGRILIFKCAERPFSA